MSDDLVSVSQKKPVVHSIVGPSGTTSKQVDCGSFGNYVDPSESRTLFYVFSGPILPHTSLQSFLAKHGWACKHFDRRLNLATDGVKPLDLLDDTVWQQVLAELESAPGDFYIMSPPCSTRCRRQGSTAQGLCRYALSRSHMASRIECHLCLSKKKPRCEKQMFFT